jgi:hypothetical protein
MAASIVLGIEILRCPACNALVRIPIKSDCPDRAYVRCSGCGFRDVMEFDQVIRKHGLRKEMSPTERAETARWLKREIDKT